MGRLIGANGATPAALALAPAAELADAEESSPSPDSSESPSPEESDDEPPPALAKTAKLPPARAELPPLLPNHLPVWPTCREPERNRSIR